MPRFNSTFQDRHGKTNQNYIILLKHWEERERPKKKWCDISIVLGRKGERGKHTFVWLYEKITVLLQEYKGPFGKPLKYTYCKKKTKGSVSLCPIFPDVECSCYLFVDYLALTAQILYCAVCTVCLTYLCIVVNLYASVISKWHSATLQAIN